MPSVVPYWPGKPAPADSGRRAGCPRPQEDVADQAAGLALEPVDAEHAARLLAVVEGGLEFLAQLLVVVAGVHVASSAGSVSKSIEVSVSDLRQALIDLKDQLSVGRQVP